MITPLMPDVIAVEVPKGAKNFFVTDGDLMFTPHYPARGGQTVLDSCVTLPPGNWAYLFCTADASEEQAAGIVESVTVKVDIPVRVAGFGMYEKFKNYESEDQYNDSFWMPKESLQSLLKSKGLKQNYAVLKKII